ncbi:MAG TPA: hypothetical protein VFK47_22920, partial [Ktedonobacteraceae bacterium]|nr:hypothetical protein [Ktedonobacteraceae bacterium]
NAVSVTVNPSVVVSITSGADFVENANSNPIGIVGSRFTAGTATYVWLLNNVATTLTGSFTVDSNGSFSVSNQTSAQFNNYGNSTGGNPTGGRGYWRLKVTQGGVDYLSNQIYAIDTLPACTISPATASIGGNVTITVSTTKFFANDVITYSWQKDSVDIANTASDRTWSQNSGNAFAGYSYAWTVTSSQFASTPYLGAGTYRIRLRFQGLTIYSNAITISA